MALRKAETSADRARDLRSNQTPPEGVLWSRLRRKQLDGLRFRRQYPIGPYIADFYCHEATLIVEVDSKHHVGGESARHDRARDHWMRERRLEVLRVSVTDIAADMDAVLRRILAVARSRTGSQEPPPPSHSV
ncbi:MAG: endonuclease domain-containing protein [Phycisphaeraceae bacterium]|nr:endonuclease domain-containing protein [Phycisphaeraceae bacterium]